MTPSASVSTDPLATKVARLPRLAESSAVAQLSVDADESRPSIGGYELLARVESSAAHDVFVGVRRARWEQARRAFVKVAFRHKPHYGARADMLFDEASALSALDHPNIVRLIEVEEHEVGALLASEFVDGVDLGRLSRRLQAAGRRMPSELAVHVVIEVLRGLAHAHQAETLAKEPLEIVHRDVNPANVLLSRSGHVRLADFGLVKMKDRLQAPTRPGMVKGKFRFMAPEYIEEQTISRSVDIYGVGIMLFELLVGGPWTHERDVVKLMRRIVQHGLPMVDLENARVPPELVGIVALATDRAQERRFGAATDMASALEAWLMQRGSYVSPSTLAAFVTAPIVAHHVR